MSTCIPPDLIAFADQRVAAAGEFLDRMIAAADPARGPDDALAVLALGSALDTHITERSALADALALAIRRLAHKGAHL